MSPRREPRAGCSARAAPTQGFRRLCSSIPTWTLSSQCFRIPGASARVWGKSCPPCRRGWPSSAVGNEVARPPTNEKKSRRELSPGGSVELASAIEKLRLGLLSILLGDQPDSERLPNVL